MSKITVYKFKPSDKENGRIVTPIELDGTCEHGFTSLVRIMGFI